MDAYFLEGHHEARNEADAGSGVKAAVPEVRGENAMTAPDILMAETIGYPFEPDGPVLWCGDCDGGIYENEAYHEVGICESCADLYTWTYYPEDGGGPVICESCGRAVEEQARYVSLPDGGGDYCADCFEKTKITAWAA